MKQVLQKTIILIGLFFSFLVKGFAQDKTLPEFKAVTIAQKRMAALDTQFKAYKTIQFPVNKLAEFVKGKEKASFRLDLGADMIWDIELEASTIISTGYKLKVQTSEGLQTIPSHPNYLYKGKIIGVDNGNAIFTIKDGVLKGSIRSNDKEFFVEPVKDYDTRSTEDELIIYGSEDVDINIPEKCGVTDIDQLKNKNSEGLRGGGIEDPLSETCLKIPIVLMADYGMYKKFNYDINALETFMLDNMNQAQGFYNGFNFETTGSVDTGQSRLEFEVIQTIISTCNTCDIVENSNYATTILKQLVTWVSQNPLYSSYYITNYWTSRNIYTTSGVFGIAGGGSRDPDPTAYCSKYGANILSHSNDNSAILRQLTAHEMGHNMGCYHDNEIKAAVNKFVVNAGPSNPTRFSRISDFGGMNYSSNLQIEQFIQKHQSCLTSCDMPSCEAPSNLELSFFSHPDSVKISWIGTGNFKVDTYLADSIQMKKIASNNVQTNSFVFSGLVACQKYFVKVIKECGGDSSQSTGVQFYTSSYNIREINTQLFGKFYDLTIQLKSRWPVLTPSTFIDNKLIESSYDANKGIIEVKNLLADGDNHKLEFKIDGGQSCYLTTNYFAPDFRWQLQTLLNVNFDSCQLPGNWKDSVIRRVIPGKQDMRWQYGIFNSPTVTISSGTFDSTCYISYNSALFDNNNYAKGGLSITSPSFDLSGYQNTFFGFDYHFVAYNFPTFYLNKAFFKVEVYNGQQWHSILERTNDKAYKPSLIYKNIWDSVPERVLISMDQYRNKEFKIRFSFDDGTHYYDSSGTYNSFHFFLGLDNVRLDGEKIGNGTGNEDYFLYPNPASDNINIRLNLSLGSDLLYSIHDISGKLVQKGKLNSTKIEIKRFASGLYLFQLFKNGKIVDRAKIFLKF